VKQAAGDLAVQKATGKTWDEWFRIFDSAGCAKQDHRTIARRAHEEFGIGDWWAQMVTVGYEQARGLRVPGQKADGFSVSKSVTVNVPIQEAFAAWSDGRLRRKWLKEAQVEIRRATEPKSLRITWLADSSHVEVNFYTKGEAKTSVQVEHNKLASESDADRQRAFWADAMVRFKEQVERES
jgi:uncharacterized protein YndB with AHSA1/START domain